MPTFENPGLPTFADTSAAGLATIPSEIQRIDINGRRFIRFDGEPAYQPKFRSQDRYTASGGDVIDEANGGWWGGQYTNTVPISFIAPEAGKGGIDNAHIANAIAALVGTGLKTLDLEGRDLRFDNSSTVFAASSISELLVVGGGGRLTYVAANSSAYPPISDALFFNIDNVGRLRISDLRLTMSTPQFTQAICTAKDENGTWVDFEVDPAFDPSPWAGAGSVDFVTEFDIETTPRSPFPLAALHFPGNGTMNFAYFSGNTWRLSGANLNPAKYTIGNAYCIYHRKVGTRAGIIRNCPDISFGNVRLELGGGFIFHNSTDLDVSGISTAPPDGVWQAFGQDIYHIKNWRRSLRCIGNNVMRTGDDCLNAHTDFMDITSFDGPDAATGSLTLTAAIYGPPDFRIGDRVMFFTSANKPVEDGIRIIEEITAISTTSISMVFDSALPAGINESYFMLDIDAVGTAEIRGNTFGYCNGSLVCSGIGTIIDDNTVIRTLTPGIDAVAYPSVFREASTPFAGLTVTNNRVLDCCATPSNYVHEIDAGAIAIGAERIAGMANTLNNTAWIEDVYVKGNHIRGSDNAGIVVQNCIAPVVVDNDISDIAKNPIAPDVGHPVRFNYCSDPIFSGNVNKPGSPSNKVSTDNISGTPVLGGNPGFDVSSFKPWTDFSTGGAPVTFSAPNDMVLSGVTENSRYRILDSICRFEFDITVTITHNTANGNLLIKLPVAAKEEENEEEEVESVEGVVTCSQLSVGPTAYNIVPATVDGESYMTLLLSQTASNFGTIHTGNCPSGQSFRFLGWIEYEVNQ